MFSSSLINREGREDSLPNYVAPEYFSGNVWIYKPEAREDELRSTILRCHVRRNHFSTDDPSPETLEAKENQGDLASDSLCH